MWFKRSILIIFFFFFGHMTVEWETRLCTLMKNGKFSQCCSNFLWIAVKWRWRRGNAWTYRTEFHSKFTSVVWGCRSWNYVQVLDTAFTSCRISVGGGYIRLFADTDCPIVSIPVLSFISKICLALKGFLFLPQMWREYALCRPRHFCIPRRLEMGPAASPGSSNFGP